MDLENQAHKLVRAAIELVPTLKKMEQTRQLVEALKLWDFYPRAKPGTASKQRATISRLERDFIADAFAVTLDRRSALWCRNGSWALFFVARGLDLALQNYEKQAAKQLVHAEEELQLGATAKAMVFARTRTQRSKPKSKARPNLRKR